MIATLVIAIITLLVLLPLTGRAMINSRFKGDVRRLFEQTGSLPDRNFSYEQLEGLPEPVRRYFLNVMKAGQPYIRYVRLKHGGWFKTGKDRKKMNIEGEQYFTTSKPGFVWKGKTSLFSAWDMYLNDKGRLVVSLFGLIRIVNEKGPEVNQAELLRWLGESVWFPTNLLPRENLHWSSIDDSHARLTFEYKGLSIYYRVTFNDNNEIVKLETERYMGDEGLTPWVGEVSEYQEVEGVWVPTVIKASWILEDGKYTYGHFRVREMEYDVPQPY